MKNDGITLKIKAEGDFAKQDTARHFYRASANDFKKVPGSPIAYWISERMRKLFDGLPAISESLTVTGGMTTADNDRFLRLWYEVSDENSFKNCNDRDQAKQSGKKWFPYNKGGSYRKWFGNRDYHVNWQNDGEEILSTGRAFPRSREYYFRESLTYTATSSSYFGIRYSDPGFLFDAKGSSCFADKSSLHVGLGFLASKIATYLLKCVNPTLEFQTGNISVLPFKKDCNVYGVVDGLIYLSRCDWNSYETSWNFKSLPLLDFRFVKSDYGSEKNKKSAITIQKLSEAYSQFRAHWWEMTQEMQRLEEENNRIFIDAYGLQDELTPEVPLSEITLTCNPHYRYGGDKTEEELEALLLADTMREFLSYATGCMFGRYSLDKPGLILANQGDTLAEYLQQVPEPSFMPNQDNVIPVLDGDWFTDDITERFRQFLRVTFGEAHYEENLAFIEAALGKDIRKYFLKDFYNDHVRRYKKRPIYWLFSSPKGSFNALMYLHRYRPDTVSVVLQYLRDFRKKLAARLDYLQQVGISPSASQSEKTRAQKEIDTLKKQLLELDDYERDTLYPLATAQIALDLDDGVKVNYLKLGPALKKIVGLDAKGED